MTQEKPPLSTVPHAGEPFDFVNPLPTVIDEMLNAWPPVLVNVTACDAEDVFTICEPNAMDAGVRLTAAGGGVALTTTRAIKADGFVYATGDVIVNAPAGMTKV